MRAVRPCKLTLAALEATFELWRDGRTGEIPVARMLGLDAEASKRRTLRARRRVRKFMDDRWTVEVREVQGRAGGGSMPLRSVPGWALALRCRDVGADALEAALRAGEPPIIGRIVDDWVILDLRTVTGEQERSFVARLEALAKTVGSS
jgi:L-seryl-tRNA(Ser) seleniumtransferase